MQSAHRPQTIRLFVNQMESKIPTWLERLRSPNLFIFFPIEIQTLDLNVWVGAQWGFVIEMQTILPTVLYTQGCKLT